MRGIWAKPEDHARIKKYAANVRFWSEPLTEEEREFLDIAFPEQEWDSSFNRPAIITK